MSTVPERSTARPTLVGLIILAVASLPCACAAPRGLDQVSPLVPADVQNAVDSFRAAHSSWRVTWPHDGRSPRLTGPALQIEAPGPLVPGTRDRMETAMKAVIKEHGAVLGLSGLEVELQNFSHAGNIWYLRGGLKSKNVAVIGRVDLGITKDGLVLMSSVVPPGAAQVKLEAGPHDVSADVPAKVSAAVSAAIHRIALRKDNSLANRISPPEPIVWWDVDAQTPGPPLLAFRAVVARATNDRLGGTYVLDAETLQLLRFDDGIHQAGGPLRAESALQLSDDLRARQPLPRKPQLRHQVAVTIRALVRTNPADPTVTDFVALPGLDFTLQNQGGGPYRTDSNGTCHVNVAAGDKVITMITGAYAAKLLDVAAELDVPNFGAATAITLDIKDNDGTVRLLDAATAFCWFYCATERFRTLFADTTGLDRMRSLECSTNGAACGFANFQVVNSVSFSGAHSRCASWALPTILLHEWGHALDYRYGKIEDDMLSEAWGDIVAMFVAGCPEIGLGYDGGTALLRTGANNRTLWEATPPYGYAYDALIGFAWHVREALINAFQKEGQDLAESLILGLLPVGPDTWTEFVRRVFEAGKAVDPAKEPKVSEILAKCAKQHELPVP